MSKIYQIPAVNMLRLEQEIAKLNKRANKLGTDPIKLNVVESKAELQKDNLGFDYTYVVNHCTVEGNTPVLNGWSLIAVLEPQENGEMLVREMPGCICPPKYRMTDMRCEHCEVIRKRSKIYLLQNDGIYKQVGKSCLADFLGSKDINSLLSIAEYSLMISNVIKNAESKDYKHKHYELCVPIHKFVIIAAVVIRTIGWKSKSSYNDINDKMPTADLVWSICTEEKFKVNFMKNNKIDFTQEDVVLADVALDWAKTLDSTLVKSTYLHDLGVSCRQNFVTVKTRGFVASVINAYKNNEKPAVSKKKAHVGVLEKRQGFEDLSISQIKDISGQYVKTLVKFVDKEGNVLVWFASGCPDWLELNKNVNIVGTVEKHEYYKGEPQTILKRVSLKPTKNLGEDMNYFLNCVCVCAEEWEAWTKGNISICSGKFKTQQEAMNDLAERIKNYPDKTGKINKAEIRWFNCYNDFKHCDTGHVHDDPETKFVTFLNYTNDIPPLAHVSYVYEGKCLEKDMEPSKIIPCTLHGIW